MKSSNLVVLLSIVSLAGAWPARAQSALPRVHLIATGGTISNAPGARLTAEQLAASIPDGARYARVSHEQFANLPSSSLTPRHWLRLAQRIDELLTGDDPPHGVVVISGTDTLEETAFFLHLTVRHPGPVVVVGAMRPPQRIGADGPANLLAAVRVAASPEAAGQGALVVLNDEINSARDVTKTDANRLQTFRSGDYGLLGIVEPEGLRFFRKVVHRHTTTSEFDVSSIAELPAVDIVLSYAGASGRLVRAAVEAGVDGLVLAGTGEGNVTPAQRDAIEHALAEGVAVVRASRTGSGRVSRPAPGSATSEDQDGRRAATIPAEDHAPVKARILLMLALTTTSDRAAIERMFREY